MQRIEFNGWELKPNIMICQQAYAKKKKKLVCQGVVHIRLHHVMGKAPNEDYGEKYPKR